MSTKKVVHKGYTNLKLYRHLCILNVVSHIYNMCYVRIIAFEIYLIYMLYKQTKRYMFLLMENWNYVLHLAAIFF